MTRPTFEWDREKGAANLLKHGVTFREAMSVFQDPLAQLHADPEHSLGERREILVGRSDVGRLLLVAFTDRDGKIRLISARKATRREHRDYEESS